MEGQERNPWRLAVTREEFMDYLAAGNPATTAVHVITGHKPFIVTLGEVDDGSFYIRYGVMMAGDIMAALVILKVSICLIPSASLDRIRAGEPAGAVLKGMMRNGFVEEAGVAVRSGAHLVLGDAIIGTADEIFTESLFSERSQYAPNR